MLHCRAGTSKSFLHPVFGYVRLVSIDGRKPIKRIAAKGAAFTGIVTRFNYARHGEPNGVVLDNGDFIHRGSRTFRAKTSAFSAALRQSRS